MRPLAGDAKGLLQEVGVEDVVVVDEDQHLAPRFADTAQAGRRQAQGLLSHYPHVGRPRQVEGLGEVVATYDNEPANCNAFCERWPAALHVFVDTQHAPNPPPLHPDVVVVDDLT